MVSQKCCTCGFEFEDGIYLTNNKTDYICIFCLKKRPDVDIADLFDQRQLRILSEILDRDGCIQLLADLI